MKRNRPSGFQQRKIKKARELETKAMSGLILKFVKNATLSASSGQEERCETSERCLPVEFEDEVLGTSQECLVESQQGLDESQHSDEEEVGASRSPQQEEDSDVEENLISLPMYSDVSDWPIPVPDNLRTDLIKKGSEPFQNKDGPFRPVARSGENLKGSTRQLTTTWFYKDLPNEEKILRTWMVYSTTKNSLFCFCCRLFATDDKGVVTSKFVTGFQSWWKLNPKVSHYESSEKHLACLEKWKTLGARLMGEKTIDHIHQEIEEKVRKKWRDILYRLLDVTLFLANQNLPFRGSKENMLSENKGNFLELVGLLSNYDPVLKEHLVQIQQSVASGEIVTSYLSAKIQNEFIFLLGNTVKEKIVSDIKKAKYFGILFDSTPDVSHTDQMCEVIRYVHIECGKVEVRESFLGFFPLAKKNAEALTNDILKNLEKDGLDINMCRSQGYDNASTMAGIHTGVQARIREINPKALFVPCANPSLNLCGVHSFGSVPSCVSFFRTLEAVYTFFSASTHRWDVLIKNVDISVKRLCETRWSAHHDAVKPVMKCFSKLVEAIEVLCDPKENVDTRGSAQVLLSAVCDFSFLNYLSLWSQVLEEINDTQKSLQKAGLSLEKCIIKLRSLKHFLKDNRDVIVENAIQYATALCEEMDIPMERRGRRKFKKMMPGEKAKDVGLTLPNELKRAMFECVDQFHEELHTRSKAMESISSKFAVVQPNSLVGASDAELQEMVPNLTQSFDEFSKEDIIVEIG